MKYVWGWGHVIDSCLYCGLSCSTSGGLGMSAASTTQKVVANGGPPVNMHSAVDNHAHALS